MRTGMYCNVCIVYVYIVPVKVHTNQRYVVAVLLYGCMCVCWYLTYVQMCAWFQSVRNLIKVKWQDGLTQVKSTNF